MAREENVISIGTLKAAADLSAKQHYFVYLSAADTVNVPTALGSLALGTLRNKPSAAGRVCDVQVEGVAKVVAGGAIAAGSIVSPTAAGKAKIAESGDIGRGIALEAASTDGDIISIYLMPLATEDVLALVAAGDYTAKQYYLVDIDTAGKAVLLAAAGAKFVGALNNAPAAAASAEIQFLGRGTVMAGGVVAKGDKVASDSGGKGVKATSGAYAGAIALTAGTDGVTMEVMFVSGLPVEGEGFTICVVHPGAVGNSLVKVLDAFELPKKFEVLSGFASCLTAPGGAYVCTITITDGATPKTITITGAAVKGETKAINTVYAKDTDMLISMQDDNASGATADVVVLFNCRWAE